VIPRVDFDVVVDVDPDSLRSVSAETVIDGIACTHGYEPAAYAGSAWAGAEETLEAELDELRTLDGACSDEDAFDEGAFEAQGERGLSFEFGVSGAVEALCAAGCPTFASCSGHSEDFSGRSRHPWILFATDRERLPLLLAAASNAGCGLEPDGGGLVVMRAPSVLESIEFGRALTRARADFDAIPPIVDREAAWPEEDDNLW